jgi:hypothetical protein
MDAASWERNRGSYGTEIRPLPCNGSEGAVALAFRNGPIEDLRAGKPCVACSGNPAISQVSDEEMKTIMKAAVNKVYSLLWQRENDSDAYIRSLDL